MGRSGHIKRLINWGIYTFVGLYYVASLWYPGGNQIDKQHKGFSWINNYWCNLLDNLAMNGQPNKAQPIAIGAMLILCFALSMFWYAVSKTTFITQQHRAIIRISGIGSLIIVLLLPTPIRHDIIVFSASGLGLCAIVLLMVNLFRCKDYIPFVWGLLNFCMIGLNNYLYFQKTMLQHLPLIQKITFLLFLTWIWFITNKRIKVGN